MSTFKFKGVIRQGRDTGEVIEYSAEEKVPVALQSAVSNSDLFKNKYLVHVTEVNTANLAIAPKGDKLKKKWAHNIYNTEGTATLSKRDIHKDMMVRPSKHHFKMKFEDCLSHNGLPELNVLEMKLT